MPICVECNQEKMVVICSVCSYEKDLDQANKLTQLTQELATERETTQQALQTSQEWHERQKEEIIAEWKSKLTNLINSRKAIIQQETTLLKGVLESHE
jgi:F0F1-type ATP synthase membrane subunit b/b'